MKQFKAAVRDHNQESSGEVIGKLKSEEQFHRQSVATPAAIRLWMREKLGGTFRSQVRLLANPSAADFKELLNRGSHP